jgi:two-component system sensor histidine kinase VicK
MELNSPSLFQQIGEQSQDVYFVYDVINNTLKYVSPAFETIFDYASALIISTPQAFLKSIHPEDRGYVVTHFEDCFNKQVTGRFEFRIINRANVTKDIRACIYPVKEDGKLVMMAGTAEDITLVKSNILYAEKINARKNTMIDILAHDLRGPIGVISMVASGIEKEPQVADNQSVLQSVSYIQQLCKRNITLIHDLMNQEFLESAEVELRKERANLVWEINDVIEQYKKSAEILSKTFMLNSSHEKLFMQIDSLKLMQVINNLISNAIKFTAENGIIEVDIQDQDTMVQIVVRDNGIGIPENLQPYLFDKFTRARRPGLNGEDTTGLGMSIIKTLVEYHGGTIRLESKENEGSAFFITIPK